MICKVVVKAKRNSTIDFHDESKQMRKREKIEKKELLSRDFALSRDGEDTGFYRILNDGFVPTRCLVHIMLSGLYNIMQWHVIHF